MNRIKISIVALILIVIFSVAVTYYTHDTLNTINSYSDLAVDAARNNNTYDTEIYTKRLIKVYNSNYYLLSILIRNDHLQQLSTDVSMAEHQLYYKNYIELTALLGDISSNVSQLDDENMPFIKNLF